MAVKKIVDADQLDAAMTASADAIRTKTGGTGAIPWNSDTGFADAISAIPTGGGSGVKTCEVTVKTLNSMSVFNRVIYNEVVNGEIQPAYTKVGINSSITLTVPCNSIMFVYATGGGNPHITCSDNITLIPNQYSDGLYIAVFSMPSAEGDTGTITNECY